MKGDEKVSKSLKLLFAVAVVALYAVGARAMGVRPETPRTIEFKGRIKTLYLDQIQYEKAFAEFTKDKNADAARVSDSKAAANAADLAAAIGRYYGKDDAGRLRALFFSRYEGMKEYTLAAFAGNDARKKAASAKLYENAVNMAAFLGSINPYVPRGDVSSLLEAHAGNGISEVDAVMSKDSATTREVYELMQKNMKILSDDLSEAIIRQFPKSF